MHISTQCDYHKNTELNAFLSFCLLSQHNAERAATPCSIFVVIFVVVGHPKQNRGFYNIIPKYAYILIVETTCVYFFLFSLFKKVEKKVCNVYSFGAVTHFFPLLLLFLYFSKSDINSKIPRTDCNQMIR